MSSRNQNKRPRSPTSDAAEELDGVIAGLRNDNLSLREQLAKESSEKLEAINCHLREREGRIAAEKLKATLLEDLEKCKHQILAADQQIASQNDLYKILQEYNTSVQQNNNNLLTCLSDSNERLRRVENEKLSIVENLGALRRDYTALQEQLASCKTLGDEAIKQKESFAATVKCLREELQQVREDRDNQRAQVQAISADVQKYQESTGKYQDAAAGADAACLENATVKFTTEEVEALLNYKPMIKKFDHKANEKRMSENNKRLRLCVKWFQTVEETHLTKQQVLRSALDSAEEKCIKTEIQMAKRLEELDGVIAGLRNDNMFLREQLAKESSEKLESYVVAITDADNLPLCPGSLEEVKEASVNEDVSPLLSVRLQEMSNSSKKLYYSTPSVMVQHKNKLVEGFELETTFEEIGRQDLSPIKSPLVASMTCYPEIKKSLAQEYLRFLNGASKEELKGLKGIGEKRASLILELREMSPEPFKQLDDLQKIGLSTKQIKKILGN